MFVPCVSEEELIFEGYSLILPAISIGNVGQLAVDLLIYNVELKKVGYLYDSSILPVAGNNPFASPKIQEGNLVTSAEVYKCDEKKLVVVQLRAPLAKGCRQIFCDHIVEWIKKCCLKQTILLTSCIASQRVDSQIQSGPFRYLLNPVTQHLNETFQQEFGWRSLEERNDNVKGGSTESFLPGGGVSKRFYQTCCKENIPLVTMLVFCSEGDNIPDAMILMYFVNTWLKIVEKNGNVDNSLRSKVEWRQPPSWDNLFGTSSFSSIF
ncbi:proteasome assembly chaperone 2-like [Dendronephthya gigantea]|uniref:proteasome assembly chaperone 2-like n=1 Tax=Dendronephthya gigantea TaxID=151771 RepID=UPI001069A24A|nr:proteasome assembly chaperone 2-like [Dendronephthya gigantea]